MCSSGLLNTIADPLGLTTIKVGGVDVADPLGLTKQNIGGVNIADPLNLTGRKLQAAKPAQTQQAAAPAPGTQAAKAPTPGADSAPGATGGGGGSSGYSTLLTGLGGAPVDPATLNPNTLGGASTLLGA